MKTFHGVTNGYTRSIFAVKKEIPVEMHLLGALSFAWSIPQRMSAAESRSYADPARQRVRRWDAAWCRHEPGTFRDRLPGIRVRSNCTCRGCSYDAARGIALCCQPREAGAAHRSGTAAPRTVRRHPTVAYATTHGVTGSGRSSPKRSRRFRPAWFPDRVARGQTMPTTSRYHARR